MGLVNSLVAERWRQQQMKGATCLHELHRPSWQTPRPSAHEHAILQSLPLPPHQDKSSLQVQQAHLDPMLFEPVQHMLHHDRWRPLRQHTATGLHKRHKLAGHGLGNLSRSLNADRASTYDQHAPSILQGSIARLRTSAWACCGGWTSVQGGQDQSSNTL